MADKSTMLCAPLSPSFTASPTGNIDSGLISGLSNLSCKVSSTRSILDNKATPIPPQSQATNVTQQGLLAPTPASTGLHSMHDHCSILNTSTTLTPNSKFARGILSTLEQYEQPSEFLHCLRIMVGVLSAETATTIPEELVSEMVYYLTLFNSVLAQAQHSPTPKQYLEQPRIYRQMEYFTSILWRMVDATHTIYFPHTTFPSPPVNILDEDAYGFWKASIQPLYTEGIVIDSEDFLNAIKQEFQKPESGVILDECLRQELLFYLDPIDCGVVTVFKFMAFANFFRPFRDCIQNMHQFHNCLWFRGYVSYPEGQQILVAQPRGSFVLHFPQHCPCPLALTCVTNNESTSCTSTLIDRYSPMLLSTEGIRLRWCKDVQVPCVINFSWNRVFFGLMTFEEAEELLSLQPVGTYLLRLSHSSPGWFVIAYVSPNRKVLQLKVAVKPNGFESGKKVFATLSEVVSCYSNFLKDVSFLSKFQQDTRIIHAKMKRLIALHNKENCKILVSSSSV
jgi:hypothetical protein